MPKEDLMGLCHGKCTQFCLLQEDAHVKEQWRLRTSKAPN